MDFLNIVALMDQISLKMIDGINLAIAIPYLSVNLTMLSGPFTVHITLFCTLFSGNISFFFMCAFVCDSYLDSLYKEYINPSCFVLRKIFFQLKPPWILNSIFTLFSKSV